LRGRIDQPARTRRRPGARQHPDQSGPAGAALTTVTRLGPPVEERGDVPLDEAQPCDSGEPRPRTAVPLYQSLSWSRRRLCDAGSGVSHSSTGSRHRSNCWHTCAGDDHMTGTTRALDLDRCAWPGSNTLRAVLPEPTANADAILTAGASTGQTCWRAMTSTEIACSSGQHAASRRGSRSWWGEADAYRTVGGGGARTSGLYLFHARRPRLPFAIFRSTAAARIRCST